MLKTLKAQFTAFALHIFAFFDLTGKIGYQTIMKHHHTYHAMNISKVLGLSLPIATAYIPLGAAFGLYLTTSNIAWYWAPISAFLVFAGSAEFLAVSFILASYPIFLTALTTILINFRHVFYGLSFPYQRLRTRTQKFYGIWALTDEIYGITTIGKGKHISGAEITLLQILCQTYWVSGALIGALLGLVIPASIKGFEFALTSMFVILAIDALRENIKQVQDLKLIAYVGLAAACGLLVEQYFIANSFLTVGLLVYLACILLDYWQTKK